MAIVGSFASGEDAASLSASWSDLNRAYPPTAVNNEDRTVTWTVGGARTITANYSGGGTLSYRINSGAWTDYTAGFSLSSSQTLAWRLAFGGDESGSFTVSENGRSLQTIGYSATGFP